MHGASCSSRAIWDSVSCSRTLQHAARFEPKTFRFLDEPALPPKLQQPHRSPKHENLRSKTPGFVATDMLEMPPVVFLKIFTFKNVKTQSQTAVTDLTAFSPVIPLPSPPSLDMKVR